MRKIYFLFLLFMGVVQGYAQTNPTPQTVPYVQDFSAFNGSASAYPAGIQGWTISGSTSTSFPTAAPSGDQAISAPTNATTGAHAGDINGKIGFLSTANAMKSIALAITTTGLSNIQVSYVAATQRQESGARIGAIGLQYRIGTSGAFINVAGSEYQNPGGTNNTSGTGSLNPQTITVSLPAAANDQAVVELRWVYREVSGGGNRPGFSIDDISVTGGGSVVNSISTGTVTTLPFCIDATTPGTGTVAFTATGTYNTTFTAYLSDATGDFGSAVNVGSSTVNGTDPSGSISITIPGSIPSGTGYRIRIDAVSPAVTGSLSNTFEIINGAKNVSNLSGSSSNAEATITWTNPSSCFDEVLIVAKAGSSVTATPSGDGSAYTASTTYSSGTAFDGGYVVYSGTTSPQTITGLTNGTTYYFKVFSRRGTQWSEGVEISVSPSIQPNPGDIVINQLSSDYSGGSDEYIELVNKTNNTYDLSGLAIRYQSAGGSSGSAGGTLTGTLLPKRFWLLSPNTTITVGLSNGIQRDGAINAGLAAASGQVALVRISDDVIIDAVGYGAITGGSFTETAAAPAPPADGGIRRIVDGVDTDDNSVDFATVDNANILLRNSSNAPLPVRFSALKASQKASGIQLNWSNATEENVAIYTIERSVDGRGFTTLAELAPKENGGGKVAYSFLDAAPNAGDNYYRIKAVETTGKTIYTNIARINPSKKGTELLVYPNPVKGGGLNVQFTNLPKGAYTVKVYAMNGQEVDARSFNHAGGSLSETFLLRNLKPGVYSLQVAGAVNISKTFLAE